MGEPGWDSTRRTARAAYIIWSATPPQWRNPQTLEKFCAEFDVSIDNLASFQAEEGFDKNVREEAVRLFGSRLPQILFAIYTNAENAAKGSEQAKWIELFMRLVAPDVYKPSAFEPFHE